MRNRWSVGLGLAAIALVVALAAPVEAAKVGLKLGHIRADTSPTHKAALRFAELAAQKSGGEVEIKVYRTASWAASWTCSPG